MLTTDKTTCELSHRILFRAVLDIREQARLNGDKASYHLADLLHHGLLDLERAAEGEMGYEEVLASLEKRATEQGIAPWYRGTLARLESGS